jgi:hypothetical protein
MRYRALVEPERKKVLEIIWHRWEKSIEMHFNETEMKGVKWLHLAQIKSRGEPL